MVTGIIRDNMAELIRIGYWSEEVLPWVDTTWDPKEKNKVIQHLDSGKNKYAWKGTSWCRFNCNERDMGSCCLTDGKYIWPEGFSHYLRVHNVKPSQLFIYHVLG